MSLAHFTLSEFDSPDENGSGQNMQEGFLEVLDDIRHACDFPFYITSGFRTPAHNASVGGSPESAHLKGYAADIRCLTASQRHLIIHHALRLGVTRIGIAKTYIHLDIAPNLDPRVIWLY